jgi:hypothetical protein
MSGFKHPLGQDGFKLGLFHGHAEPPLGVHLEDLSLRNESNARVRRASDINKMLLGFLIGSAKSYMGL